VLKGGEEVNDHGVLHFDFGGSFLARYRRAMSTVLEIERAIETLPPADFRSLAEWFDELREQRVDAALEKAVLDGKFDAMAEQALRDAKAGKCIPLDEFLDRA
jgi:hypothetical protein